MAIQNSKKPAISTQFKLGTINVSTAREDTRLQQIADEVARSGLLACALQETKRIGNGSAMLKARDLSGVEHEYHFYWAGTARKRIDGVGMLVKVDRYTEILDVRHQLSAHGSDAGSQGL